MIGVSPSRITMVIINSNPSTNFYHQHIYTHAPEMNTLGKLNNHYGQSRIMWDVDATLCHTKSYKFNYKIDSRGYVNLPGNVTIQNGISSELSTAAIILGSPNPYYDKIRITFVVYAQVYIGTTNSTKQITVRAISLLPENERGWKYFMLLSTGKQLHAYICTELPMN